MKKISTSCICLLLTVITNSQKQGGRKSETVLEGGVKADATFVYFQMTGIYGTVSSFAPGDQSFDKDWRYAFGDIPSTLLKYLPNTDCDGKSNSSLIS